MSPEEEEEEVATVCAITQCVACLTYIHVEVAHTNTEDDDNYHEGCNCRSISQISLPRIKIRAVYVHRHLEMNIKRTPVRVFTLRYSMSVEESKNI